MSIAFTDFAGKDYTPGNYMKGIADEYIAQVHSIIEINRSIIPELVARKEDELSGIGDEILDKLSPEERTASRKYLGQVKAGLGEILESEKWRDTPDFSIEMPNRGAGAAIGHLVMQLAYRAKAGSKDALLRKSLLVSAISTFEVLFAQVARTIYSVNTSSLNDSEHSFTLQELADFGTLDDAREYLIEKRVSTLLRESIDGWEKWLKRSCGGVSMESFPVFWPLIRESFARRNLLVHTGGVVNQLYLSVVAKLSIPDSANIRAGVRLDVDEDYLDWVLQELLALGHILICTVGAKLYKKEGELFSQAAVFASRDFSLWRANHASKAVCNYALSSQLSRKDEMMMRVRRWLSIKETEGLEGIRTEIEGWDTSGLGLPISHCKAVLLDDLNRSQEMVEKLINQGDLSRFEVAVDPLYKKLLPHLSMNQQASPEESGSNE
ncbi:hypothetical protein [Streptomyces fungicidicus]|uniref:Uncharacterized protein n=1 Tax=Streptomyces fungicidicus TaxID=68203 RepID=A0ACC7Y805_9ACTN|nr:hypothetical protein [Streptomyces fungicidicus]NUV78159.1 hypothetical protein [Streptomyces fungicidicus]